MTKDDLLHRAQHQPETIDFADTMQVIEQVYLFHETAFDNGSESNAAGQNSGSCKLLRFAQINDLTEVATLALFGEYYRSDVLGSPDGHDHQNIRQFMQQGWSGVKFYGEPLVAR